MAGQTKGCVLAVAMLHPNSQSCAEFFSSGAGALGRSDFSQPLKILSDHWVESVGDLRLLTQEGLLRTLGLPIRLCVWIEDELVKLASSGGAASVAPSASVAHQQPAAAATEKKARPTVNGALADVDLADDDSIGKVCRYVSDFDTNGILYYIGTGNATRSWSNPAADGLVTVSASGLMPDSVPASALAGRETVRCVTANQEGAWFSIDLGDRWVFPTHYTLRHYSSWDTECVRDWRLEGSADKDNWVTLRDHKADASLNGKGGAFTWPVLLGADSPAMANKVANPFGGFFCAFRIILTGPNSNGHMYLACSGLELYGALLSSRPSPAAVSALAKFIATRQRPMSASTPSLPPRANSIFAAAVDRKPSVLVPQSPMTTPAGSAVPMPSPSPAAASGAAAPAGMRWEMKRSSDFDTNGILYNLATAGGSRPWTNPADAGLVAITSSSLMQDSVPVSAVVGRDVVRCVTRAVPDSWFAIDLLDKAVRLTQYTLRHYNSWDSEAVRNWRFEASNNPGVSWVALSVHENDESLYGKGATHTFTIPDSPAARQPYRHFRIFQTGENSNKHHYLAVSGLELYGCVYQADLTTPFFFPLNPFAPAASASASAAPPSALSPLPSPPSASSPPQAPATTPASAPVQLSAGLLSAGSGSVQLQLIPVSDFDGRGAVHFIGTKFGTAAWRNPVEAGDLRVFSSSLAGDSTPLSSTCGMEIVRCVTKPEPKSWMVWDFSAAHVAIRPTHYTLRHYSSWDVEALRNWVFQGSDDGVSWTTLREHNEDQSLNAKGATCTWTIDPQLQYFSQFRVYQTGPNSNKHHYLACSGFEMYGWLVVAKGTPIGPLPAPVAAQPSISVAAQPLSVPASPSAAVSPPMAAPVAAGSAPLPPYALPRVELNWDEEAHGPSLFLIKPNEAKNRGSQDKWQLIRSKESFDSGRHAAQFQIVADAKTSNTWRAIVGVVPAALDCAGSKQWVGTNGSWGWIAGTGGKCHMQAKSLAYGSAFGGDDLVGVVVDHDRGQIEFFRNGVSQGIAFDTLSGRVHFAVSVTGTDTVVRISHWTLGPPAAAAPVAATPTPLPSPSPVLAPLPVAAPAVAPLDPSASDPDAGWDAKNKSMFMDVAGNDVSNKGSADKWQSARSLFMFGKEEELKAGASPRQTFEVEFVSIPITPNSWQCIVGVVPSSFTCAGSKQWVGAAKSWGYIAGTGGVCHDTPQSVPYGEKYGQGDVIGVVMDFAAGTVEFTKNGVSQGIAHKTLKGPVHAAVSLTATGSLARLKIPKL